MLAKLFESPVQLLLLVVVIVLLFGAKRLPDAARGVGRSMRILKSEVRDMKAEDDARPAAATNNAEQSTTALPAKSASDRHDDL